MAVRKRNILLAVAIGAIVVAGGVAIEAARLAARIEPYAREEAIRYLSQRFDSDVALESLHLRLPGASPLRLLLTRGRGITARVEGAGLSMRLKGRSDAASPLFSIQKFHCDVSLESVLHPPVIVSQIVVDGMAITVPPREHRTPQSGQTAAAPPNAPAATAPGVSIQRVTIHNASLTLQARDPKKIPLRFDIASLLLESTGAGAPMKYDAALTNAKPPGDIRSSGTFGPWIADEPGDTPLTGDYHFQHADLGVFNGIAGTLDSTGNFEGRLNAIKASGSATVPNFRLRLAGNPVPLTTRFSVLVDGTNGNTILQPVDATLGTTHFTTSGGIIRHEAGQARTISLKVSMPNGDLRDVLRLAMKGSPFMEGRLALDTRIDIPPLSGKVREKLVLDGHFMVLEGKFLHSTIQQQIDRLSQRARGQMQNAEADNAVSHMTGVFHLENAVIRFQSLSFGVPGAKLDLAGNYGLDTDGLDFAGTLKTQATVSQMVTGWKSLLLKPVDRFFEKDGAGTLLHIHVDGTSKEPNFGVNLAGREFQAPIKRK